VSGVMSFICSHDGVVREKNLGRDTPAIAKVMALFDPDSPKSAGRILDLRSRRRGRDPGARGHATRGER
jgi:hypothetical protein